MSNTAEEKKRIMETMTEAHIFEGCKHPELIDLYIQGVKDGAAAQRLTIVKEKIKDLGYRSIWEDDKEILLVEREELLTLIEEELQ